MQSLDCFIVNRTQEFGWLLRGFCWGPNASTPVTRTRREVRVKRQRMQGYDKRVVDIMKQGYFDIMSMRFKTFWFDQHIQAARCQVSYLLLSFCDYSRNLGEDREDENCLNYVARLQTLWWSEFLLHYNLNDRSKEMTWHGDILHSCSCISCLVNCEGWEKSQTNPSYNGQPKWIPQYFPRN